MDSSITASGNRRALRPRASPPGRSRGLRDYAHCTHNRCDVHFDHGHFPAATQTTLGRQHAALANMVRAVEPDFAEEMAARLLAQYGSLTALLAEPAKELFLSTGNQALATILSTAKHVVVEALLDELPKTPFSPSNQDVLRYITAIMGGLTREEAHVFFLDGRLRFLRHEVFSYGSEARAEFPMHAVFRRALQIGALQLVLIHNHPSGNPKPSEDDLLVTKQIAAAGQAVGLAIRDHLIVASPNVFSFRAAGLL